MKESRDRRFLVKAKTVAGIAVNRLGLGGVSFGPTFPLSRIGLVLGTGWGDSLKPDGQREVNLKDLPGFETLGELEGHDRCLVLGNVGNKQILALRGRVHLNEGHTPDIPEMVRLQTEMLLQLGVEKLIVTSAVGSLNSHVGAGDLVIVKSFLTLFAPPMPLWGGEFCSPEDALDISLASSVSRICRNGSLHIVSHFVTHAMVRGPFFESRKIDKDILRSLGADVVGMSMLPEACVAALFGAKVIGLGFVTNTASEVHSHEANMARVKQEKEKLSLLLKNLVAEL